MSGKSLRSMAAKAKRETRLNVELAPGKLAHTPKKGVNISDLSFVATDAERREVEAIRSRIQDVLGVNVADH